MNARVISERVREETRESTAILKGRVQEDKFLHMLFGYEISCRDVCKDDKETEINN